MTCSPQNELLMHQVMTCNELADWSDFVYYEKEVSFVACKVIMKELFYTPLLLINRSIPHR